MNTKIKAVIERIKYLEDAILKSREYLESGKHASWSRFQPLFTRKVQDGETMPPHKDWVKNFFIPQMERALARAEKTLQVLEREATDRAKG